jgi:hypothetical protein
MPALMPDNPDFQHIRAQPVGHKVGEATHRHQSAPLSRRCSNARLTHQKRHEALKLGSKTGCNRLVAVAPIVFGNLKDFGAGLRMNPEFHPR